MPRAMQKVKKSKTKKVRKTELQMKFLEAFLALDPDWCNKTIKYLHTVVDLSEEKIYKWGYQKLTSQR